MDQGVYEENNVKIWEERVLSRENDRSNGLERDMSLKV